MVREISQKTLEKMSQLKLKKRLEMLGREYRALMWNLESESGIGMNRDYLFTRKDIIESEISRTRAYIN